MPKNIVIFSDGTGQEGGSAVCSNIYKLFNMIEDRTDRQVAFYDAGCGTGWRKITGNVGGMGISRNIKQCYRFIFDHFEAGDRIFLFGFSRGAATVRSLSSFIHYFGMLPKSRPDLIERAYKIYKISKEEKRKARARDFLDRHHTMWSKVKFIGCFDTVAALGLPWKSASALLDGIPFFKSKFHNFLLSESLEHAYHALAIDDQRKTFHPVLWDSVHRDDQELRQVWFCGMHTDVGGGYEDQHLAGIPLAWIIGKAVDHGLHIFPGHRVQIVEDPTGKMHDSRGEGAARLYRKKTREWSRKRTDKPVIHASVLERSKSGGNETLQPYHPWILDIDHETEPWVRLEDHAWNHR